jgi:FkbM family methyltransferase
LLTQPHLAQAAFRYRVAAAIEHLEPIRHTAARTLIDIGANKGQFSLAFRSQRPGARIEAFEPLPQPANIYERVFARDARVALHRVAIANEEGIAQFFVADRDDSSSLLPPGQGQADAFGVHNERTIQVEVKRLDSCVTIADLPRPIMMKIDVQGAELKVLQGCAALDAIDFVYVELSYVVLYDGQPLFDEVATYLRGRGFDLVGVFNQVVTQRFGPTQADFLFRRASTEAA